MENNNDISDNDISDNDISDNHISDNDNLNGSYQRNILFDLSSNINITDSNDTITNLLQNIYQEAITRSNSNVTAQDRYLNNNNNLDRLRILFDFDNSLNNVFNEINPLLINSNNSDPYTINLNDVFSNLLQNTFNNHYTSNGFNNILNESFNRNNIVYKKILSEKGKDQLKRCLFKDSTKTNNSCPIFHLDFDDDDDIIELPCQHCFVPEAIEKWLNEEQAVCPVCRFELDSKEVKNSNNVENNIQEVEEADSDDEEIDSDDEELITEHTVQENDEDRLLQQAILDSLEKK